MIFDEPYINEYREPRPDGFREVFKAVLCPACFEPYFNELTDDDDEGNGC